MKRSEYKTSKDCSFEEVERLDKVNNDRVITTKERVAHALRLIDKSIADFDINHLSYLNNVSIDDIAHAINLLEAGNEELKWACEYYEWNDDVCSLIDNAIVDFGLAISFAFIFKPKDESNDEDVDSFDIKYHLHRGACDLSKALAALCRWFDEDVDVSEV